MKQWLKDKMRKQLVRFYPEAPDEEIDRWIAEFFMESEPAQQKPQPGKDGRK